jgi:hypothetical protein
VLMDGRIGVGLDEKISREKAKIILERFDLIV